MKRILLTTTSLVLAAGVAQAEVTFSGKAEAGISRTEKVAADCSCCWQVVSLAQLSVTEDVGASAVQRQQHCRCRATDTPGRQSGLLTTTAAPTC